MTIALNFPYQGYLTGAVVTLPAAATESAMIAQGRATASAAASTTTGAATANLLSGKAAIAAAASSVVITNSLVDANTHVYAVVAQAAADVSLLRVERVVSAAGSFTIFGTANATATTLIDWAIILPGGFTQTL